MRVMKICRDLALIASLILVSLPFPHSSWGQAPPSREKAVQAQSKRGVAVSVVMYGNHGSVQLAVNIKNNSKAPIMFEPEAVMITDNGTGETYLLAPETDFPTGGVGDLGEIRALIDPLESREYTFSPLKKAAHQFSVASTYDVRFENISRNGKSIKFSFTAVKIISKTPGSNGIH